MDAFRFEHVNGSNPNGWLGAKQEIKAHTLNKRRRGGKPGRHFSWADSSQRHGSWLCILLN